MKYRLWKKTGWKVSEIAFGCMSLPVKGEVTSELLLGAVESGINFFDTADLYQWGENERMVGNALKKVRHNVFISTKVGNQPNPDGKTWKWNPAKSYILQAADKSLKRLQTDYIDLYQLHGGTIDDPIDDTIEAFEILKSQGKIRHYGLSSIRPNVIRQWVSRSDLAGVMMQFSLLDRRAEETCIDLLDESGIAVMARGVLAKGILAGKPAADYLNHTSAQVERIVQVANRKRELIEEVAIKFVMAVNAIHTAVIGMRTKDQLEHIINAVSSEDLTESEINDLKKEAKADIYHLHR